MSNNTTTQSEMNGVAIAHTKTELIAGSVAAAILATTIWVNSKEVLALGWLVAIQFIYGLRFFLARRASASMDEDRQQKSTTQIKIGLFAVGALWGVAGATCMMTHGLVWSTIMVLVTNVVLCILVLGSYLGHRSLVVPFAAASIFPVIVSSLLLLQKETIVVAVSSLVFMAAISAAAKYVDQMLHKLYATSSERDHFYSMLKASEQEIQRLQVGVKTNTEKRVALESELEEASSELQLTKGKADALSTALERVSPYDSETGLLNAEKYQNVLEREWSRMLRQELPLTAVHMSIDNFEGYVETYGKIAHEACIRRIADLIKKTGSRPGDVAARLDEDKFVLLFPEADHKNGERLADELRDSIRQLNMPNANSPMHSSVTASFGVATVIPNSDIKVEELKNRADGALYEAQFQGGDKVVRFRTMNTARLERWDRDSEGEFSPDGLLRKLAVWGYEAQPKTLKPGAYNPDRRVQVDTVDAVVSGNLKVTLEGESRLLKAGDCLFLPKGVVTSTEVVGKKPVICLEALRA